MDRTVSYAGFHCSTQRSNNPTRSGGHAPSHGMEPFFRRSAIASAGVWTSAQDHRSNALRIELRSFSRNRGLISASKLISGAGIFTSFRPGGAAIDGAAVELTSLVTPDAIDARCDSAGRGAVLAGEGAPIAFMWSITRRLSSPSRKQSASTLSAINSHHPRKRCQRPMLDNLIDARVTEPLDVVEHTIDCAVLSVATSTPAFSTFTIQRAVRKLTSVTPAYGFKPVPRNASGVSGIGSLGKKCGYRKRPAYLRNSHDGRRSPLHSRGNDEVLMTTTAESPILVLGATGGQGGPVTAALLARQARVRAMVRRLGE